MICSNLLVTCIYFILIGKSNSNDFIRFGDYEYSFGSESQRGNYPYANQECFKRNATLVIIYMEEINQFIKEYINGTKVNYYIGLQRINEGGRNSSYLWIDGTLPTFFDWGPRQPSNKEEVCVEIARYEYKWNDVHCNEANRSTFICQKKVQSCNNNNPCAENSHCDDSTGYIRCTCNRGYEGDGFINCTDIDECETLVNKIRPNGNCVNTPGSFNYNIDLVTICLPSMAVVAGILIGIVVIAIIVLLVFFKKWQKEYKSQQFQRPIRTDHQPESPNYVQANAANFEKLQNQQRLASNSTNIGKVDDVATSSKIAVMSTDESGYLTPMKELPSTSAGYITLDDVKPVVMPTDENGYLTPIKELPSTSSGYVTINDVAPSNKPGAMPTEKKGNLATKAAVESQRYESIVDYENLKNDPKKEKNAYDN